MSKYAILIEKVDKNYSAYCPDIPGVIATGPTVEETTDLMKEAIEFHLKGLEMEGLSIPEPTTTVKRIEVAQ